MCFSVGLFGSFLTSELVELCFIGICNGKLKLMCDEKTISKQFHSEEKKLKTNEIAKLFNFRMPFAESQLLLS